MARTAELRARNVAFWDQAAPGWIRHAERQDELGRPLGAAAMAALRAAPGERVLDVGCGCGGTTAEIAAAVGPAGAAVGVDVSEAMVAAARHRFPAPGGTAPVFLAGDIETMGEVPGAPFDAAHSRMTLMLLADPVAGLTTIARSLRPGGRLAATTFRDAAAVPWLMAVVLGAAPHLGDLPPLPLGDEPGPFSFGEPARIERLLTAAGFGAVAVEPRDVALVAPDDPDLLTAWLIEVGPAGAAYRRAEPPARAAARSGAARLLASLRTPGAGYRLPTGIWLITATTG
ncbi:methyltransferase domain-containing protein [Amorphoplanes nipponensis]|uniref:Methyltransferase n=1 Tax=Actinoplanes nipponensis TaxID=135950 RepID=A0A919MU80_9ACTN|nr:methyltransferase domain-containing protein [Actinoplanes nipponensis]GIE54378.1 methyltransferase [Actinoplanes nipponensis]